MGSLEGTFDTKLHEAVRICDIEEVKVALQQGYDPNLIGLYQWSALHEAAQNGEKEILQLLLQKKGDPNKADYLQSRTAMHYAAEQGHIDCLKMLIDAGGKYDIKDANGNTCLDLATPGGRKILEKLKVRDMMLKPEDDTDDDKDECVSSEKSTDKISLSTSSMSGEDSVKDKCPELGYVHFSVEYHSGKSSLKIRIWQLSDLLLPPSKISMIHTIYAKSYLLPDKRRETKRKTEEVKVDSSEGHIHWKKKRQVSIQHVFAPSTFKFSRALEYNEITKDIIADKHLQIEVCITQRYSRRSFLIGMLIIPLNVAVKKVVKERIPLIPCMNHTIPSNMKVYSASELNIIYNQGNREFFFSNPNVRVTVDTDNASDRAASNPDLQMRLFQCSPSVEVNMDSELESPTFEGSQYSKYSSISALKFESSDLENVDNMPHSDSKKQDYTSIEIKDLDNSNLQTMGLDYKVKGKNQNRKDDKKADRMNTCAESDTLKYISVEEKTKEYNNSKDEQKSKYLMNSSGETCTGVVDTNADKLEDIKSKAKLKQDKRAGKSKSSKHIDHMSITVTDTSDIDDSLEAVEVETVKQANRTEKLESSKLDNVFINVTDNDEDKLRSVKVNGNDLMQQSRDISEETSDSQPNMFTWDYYDFSTEAVTNEPQRPTSPWKEGAAPVILPMTTTMQISGAKQLKRAVLEDKGTQQGKLKKKTSSPLPGNAVPLVPEIVITQRPTSPWKEGAAPVILPMTTTMEISGTKQLKRTVLEDKGTQQGKLKKKKLSPIPGNAVPLVPEIVITTVDSCNSEKAQPFTLKTKLSMPEMGAAETNQSFHVKQTENKAADARSQRQTGYDEIQLDTFTINLGRSPNLVNTSVKSRTSYSKVKIAANISEGDNTKEKTKKLKRMKEGLKSLNANQPANVLNVGVLNSRQHEADSKYSLPKVHLSCRKKMDNVKTGSISPSVILDMDKIGQSLSESHVVEVMDNDDLSELDYNLLLFTDRSDATVSNFSDVEAGLSNLKLRDCISPTKYLVPLQVYNIDDTSGDESVPSDHSYIPTTEL